MTTYTGQLSINKDAKSPYWLVTFIGSDGKQRRRSTKVPHAGGVFRGQHLTKAQAEKRANQIAYEIACAEMEKEKQEAPDNTTARALFRSMLDGKLGRVTHQTYVNARVAYDVFLAWLGERADKPARLITKADICEFIVHRRSKVRCKTAKKDLCAISSAFNWMLNAELITRNPCKGVTVPPDTRDEKVVKEAFTEAEIRLLIEKLPDEWSSAVRCCIGTYGQRLGDILSLKWEQFDWDANTVRIVTGKTAKHLIQPMQADFRAWARARYEEAIRKGGDAAIWVHPSLRSHTNPSPEFTQLVRLHGIGVVGKDAGGNRRAWHSKTFHCLRSSVVTMLHAAGVSQGMAMQLVGHDSQEVHAVYLRPSEAQLAAAAANLPKF